MEINSISSQIIKAAIHVHKELGPGLLESYQSCMVIELEAMDVKVQSEVPLAITYRGHRVHEEGFRMDLLVNYRCSRVEVCWENTGRLQEAASDVLAFGQQAPRTVDKLQRGSSQRRQYQGYQCSASGGLRVLSDFSPLPR